MEITFLGTGTSQGIPVIACECDVCKSSNVKDKRLRSSIMIEHDDVCVVIDTGPDFREQMLRESVIQLDAIIYTHEHKDHIAGMDDIRAFNYKQKSPMQIYANERVQEALKREFHYVFSGDNYPGIPQVSINTIANKPFNVKGLNFIPVEVMHYKLPVLGFRINDFTYITDANSIEEEELQKMKGSKVIVLNALRKEPHVSHFTLSEAIGLIEKLEPEKAYLIHMSHLLGKHDDIQKELPSNIELAYDGLKLSL